MPIETDDLLNAAYELGWQQGYKDKLPENPFNLNDEPKQFIEYELGYKEGSWEL